MYKLYRKIISHLASSCCLGGCSGTRVELHNGLILQVFIVIDGLEFAINDLIISILDIIELRDEFAPAKYLIVWE